MNIKKVLVLGSSGQIGGFLVKFLQKKNYEVIEFDIVKDKSEDLRILNVLDEIIKNVDFVFFLAFDVGGSRYLEKLEKTYEFIENNSKIMVNTFESLKKHNIPFIFASSQMSNMSYSSYGVLKMLGEYYTKSLNGVVVKFWNVYGLEEDEEKSHVITDFIKMSKNGKIVMRTDGSESRQFLFAEDCSESLEIVMQNYGQINREKSLDITNFEWTKVLEIAKIISKINNCQVIPGKSTDLQKDKKNEPSNYILNYWKPKTSLEDGIKNIFNQML